ncbi:MAG TPA: hypothetical protein EYG92_11030 [Lutibacter sp.]|nr:hypothetical protein [Lutibacter sp.]
MKNLFIILVIFSLFSCDDPQYNDLLPDKAIDVTINLNLPAYISLQTPGGWAETSTKENLGHGFKGLFIYRSNSRYYAYERACPHKDVDACEPMTFDGSFLICPCDQSKFNFLNGGGSTDVTYRAREYHVQEINSATLRITNY